MFDLVTMTLGLGGMGGASTHPDSQVNETDTNNLLLEGGDALLLETGDQIVLEAA
jgi:hypothetical protein